MAIPSRFHPWIMAAIVFVVAFDLAFAWQRIGGAYDSEFGGHPDEAAHYVTGVMVRDYLAAGFPGSPLKFADEYYRHYPKVGLGVWPPLFYIVQSAWTLPFTPARTSVLLMMAALASIVAGQIFQALRQEFGPVWAGLGAALFLSLPLVREHYSMVMAEMLCTATMFGAMLALGRFIDAGRRADALWFGVLAGLAILTKGNGLALVIMVPLALLFSNRWRLLADRWLWAGATIAALLGGPWTWIFRNYGRDKGGWLESSPSWHFTLEAAPYYAGKLVFALGPVLCILLVLGLYSCFAPAAPRRGWWSTAAALICSVLIFQWILPVGLEARHLLPAIPAALMFAVAGAAFALQRLRGKQADATAPVSSVRVAVVVSLVIFGLTLAVGTLDARSSFLRWRKGWTGFSSIARQLAAEADSGSLLISSDASGEGMFISEVAMHERRPGHVIERASKVLATMQWSGRNARPKFNSDDDMLAYLLKSHIAYVVIDDSVPDEKRSTHHDMLHRIVGNHPEHFWLVASAEIFRGNELQSTPVVAYRILRKN